MKFFTTTIPLNEKEMDASIRRDQLIMKVNLALFVVVLNMCCILLYLMQ